MQLKPALQKSAGLGICLATIFTMILAGCGGGSGGGSNTPAAITPATNTLSGVAAVGSPIVNGSISARCAAGSPLSTTTNSTGDWQVTLASTHVLPCAVQVSNGTTNTASNTTPYHSIATTPGTVNVTPLTDLMVANLTGTATPGTWFAGLSTTTTSLATITQGNVDSTLAKLRSALNGLSQLSTVNPITTAFTPIPGNVVDDTLTALKTAMASSGITYTTMLSNASAPAYTAPVASFNTALTTAYASTASGSIPSANFAGTYTLSTSGGTTATVTFDSAGNVTSCKVSTVVVCSGKLTPNSTTGTANIQVTGNDGLNPIDTTVSVSGTIAANGSASGSYSGNSVTTGAFSGTFTGSNPVCTTPPAAPTGVTVTQVGPAASTLLFDNYITWNPVANASFYEVFHGKQPDSTHVVFKLACAYLPGCTDTWAGSNPFSFGHEYYAVKAVNSCGVRSALSTIVPAPTAVAAGALPTVSGISPSSGAVGTVVTITGTNFSATPANNTVMFNGTQATVTSATATSITVAVPSGATTGTISVATAGGTTTSGSNFVVTTPATGALTFSSAPFGYFGDSLTNWNLPSVSNAGQTLSPVFTTNLYFQGTKVLTTSSTAKRWSTSWTSTDFAHSLTLYYYMDPAPISFYIDSTKPAQAVEYLYVEITDATVLGTGFTTPLQNTVCFVVGSIPASASSTGSTSCSSLGITFNRTAGSITFNNTSLYSQDIMSVSAPSPSSMTGAFVFTPF